MFYLVGRDDAGGVVGVDAAHDAKRLICLIEGGGVERERLEWM